MKVITMKGAKESIEEEYMMSNRYKKFFEHKLKH